MDVDRYLPKMTEPLREMASELVPNEVQVFYNAYATALTRYLAVAPELSEASILDPDEPEKLDAIIKKALISLVKAGVKSPLTKLSWLCYVMISDQFAVIINGEDPDRLPSAVLYNRVYETDFYLSEFRALSSDVKDLHVTFWHPDKKSYVQKPRTFPMWEVEKEHNLCNREKAKAWYRRNLQERNIVSAP